MMFGEEVSGRVLTKGHTFVKARILTDCEKLTSNEHIEDLLSVPHKVGLVNLSPSL